MPKKLTLSQVKKKMNAIVKNTYALSNDKFFHGTKSNVPFSYNMIAGINNKLAGMRDKVK